MGYAIVIFALSRLTLSDRIELTRVNPELFQDRSAETGADIARDRGCPNAIFYTCVASLALRFIDYDNRIGLPRELAELTNKIILIRQGSISPQTPCRTFPYESQAMKVRMMATAPSDRQVIYGGLHLRLARSADTPVRRALVSGSGANCSNARRRSDFTPGLTPPAFSTTSTNALGAALIVSSRSPWLPAVAGHAAQARENSCAGGRSTSDAD